MDAISPAIGRSVTVTPGGVQTQVSIPGRSLRQVSSVAISVVGATNHYLAPAGTWAKFNVGDIVDVLGFVAGAGVNNGRKRVTAITATQLFVSDTALIDEAAGPAVTFDQMSLPRYVMLLATTVVPKANLWNTDGGAAPAAGTAFYVGLYPTILDCYGYTTVVIDGASGSVSITPLEDG